jgi:hypothetical protein
MLDYAENKKTVTDVRAIMMDALLNNFMNIVRFTK